MRNVGQKTFRTNYRELVRDLYHGCEPVCYRSIDELPGPEVGVRFVFASNWPDFSHFLIAADDGDFVRRDDGAAVVRFEDSTEQQARTLRVKAVREDGEESRTYTVRMDFMPKKAFASGRVVLDNDRIRMTINPLMHPAAVPMEDWGFPLPTDEERDFAIRKWSGAVEGVECDYERAKALARPIIEDLWPSRGSPSDRMQGLPPFEQYDLMVRREERGFCTTFAAIFECACKSFGILTRRISMCDSPTASHRLFVQNTSNHVTTEVFDRSRNQWILMDLTYQMLGAFLGAEGPLTTAEFHMFINQPHRRERLQLLLHDLNDRTDKLLPFAECPRKEADSYSYEGWNTVFEYRRV